MFQCFTVYQCKTIMPKKSSKNLIVYACVLPWEINSATYSSVVRTFQNRTDLKKGKSLKSTAAQRRGLVATLNGGDKKSTHSHVLFFHATTYNVVNACSMVFLCFGKWLGHRVKVTKWTFVKNEWLLYRTYFSILYSMQAWLPAWQLIGSRNRQNLFCDQILKSVLCFCTVTSVLAGANACAHRQLGLHSVYCMRNSAEVQP